MSDWSPAQDSAVRLVEAAKYAVLRRMAPSVRHGIVGELHPLAIFSEVMVQGLSVEAPDMTLLRQSAEQLRDLSRKVAGYCTDLIKWMTSDGGGPISLAQGVGECIQLLTSDFRERGFSLQSAGIDHDAKISATALRAVLPAALLAASDAYPKAADIMVVADISSREASLHISLHPIEHDRTTVSRNACHRIGWDDVRILAAAESVGFVREDDALLLKYPRLG